VIKIEGLEKNSLKREVAQILADHISMPQLRKEAANHAYREHLSDKGDELEETFNRVMAQRLKTEADRQEMQWWERQHKSLKRTMKCLEEEIEGLKSELDSKTALGERSE